MAFDRSKYTGGSRKAQAQKAEVASKFERRGGGPQNWHYVADGKNTFRIAPPHDPENSAYEVYRTTTLECMKPVYKDGEDTGEKELGRKKIVSALVHHDKLSELGVEGDPVELYVKLVKDIAFKSIKDKDERRKYLAPINGFRGSDKKWVWGIEPRTSFLAYAWDLDSVLGKLELNKGWMSDIDRLSEELEEGDEPLEIDPFSNPVEGYPLLITKSKNDAGKTEYIIDKDVPSRLKKETWDDFFTRTAITDKQLEELDGKKSLFDSYTNSYKMGDFESAMDGLKRFDEKYEFGIIDTDEFQDAIAKIKTILDEDVDDVDDTVSDEALAELETEVTPTIKKTPVKKAPAKKAPVKKVDPAIAITAEVSAYIEETYGDEYIPQIPTDMVNLNEWLAIVMAKEVDGDLPLVAVEDFTPTGVETPVELEPEAEVETPVEKESDEVVGSDAEKLRKQMQALRKAR